MNRDTDLTPSTNMNSKWIPDVTVKVLEGGPGENLDDLGCGGDFLGTTPEARFTKELRSWTSLK